MPMATKPQFVATIVFLLGQLSVAAVYANPNHKVVDAALAVHGKEFSPELHKKATDFYEDAKTKLFDFLEKEAKNDVQKIDGEDLGNTHMVVTRLKRAASQLQLLGEPAGHDFERRGNEMHNHLGRLIAKSQSFPRTQKYIESFRQFINNSAAARSKAILEMHKLAMQGKWEAAENELYRVYDRLDPGTVFLTPEENKAIYSPFSEVDVAITSAMLELRSAKANEILQQAIPDNLPNYAAILAEIDMAITSLGATGQATWHDEQISGPELVTRIGQKWSETQAGALRARGKYWALTRRSYGTYASRSAADPAVAAAIADPNAADKFANDYAAFSRDLMKSFPRLVEAHSARLAGNDVPQTYVAYLRALAPLARQTNSPEFTAALSPALQKLVDKNPQLREGVAAYDSATADLLRWRARVAESHATVQAAEYLPIEKRFHEGTVSNQSYVGLFPETGTQIGAQLLAPAPDVMTTAVKRLMGQKAAVRDIIRLSGESKSAIARFQDNTYGNVPAPLSLEPEVEALKFDLLVSNQAPPLTLMAMQAVLTAERGDMAAIGGEITGVYLEGVITRFAALPNSAAILTTLGQLPTDWSSGVGMSHVLMRFDIGPQWALHDYFFLRLAPRTNTTAPE